MKRSSKPIEFNKQEGRRTKWLLKLDEHGCLIPGCHLADATVEAIAPEIKFAIYPNPASGYLNFQLRTARPVREATFRILDAGGRTVKEFNSSGHPGGHDDSSPQRLGGRSIFFGSVGEGGRTGNGKVCH